MRWTSEISVWEPPYRFVDNQVRGPYKLWHHEHTFNEQNGGTLIRDHVDYALPFGIFGEIAHALMVRRDVETIFKFRQQRLEQLLAG
jgi:ligand-binding SRPBCC domain-containing protein